MYNRDLNNERTTERFRHFDSSTQVRLFECYVDISVHSRKCNAVIVRTGHTLQFETCCQSDVRSYNHLHTRGRFAFTAHPRLGNVCFRCPSISSICFNLYFPFMVSLLSFTNTHKFYTTWPIRYTTQELLRLSQPPPPARPVLRPTHVRFAPPQCTAEPQ